MMSFLQTGKALYILAAICLAGIISRLVAGSFYKGLIKESVNMALTKNKYLRNLKQNAEDTYRINQGMNNTRVYLERQLYGLRVMGMSVRGLDNLSGQLTLLCFLAGGAAAFLSYWYRSDNYYIVLYGTVGILTGMLTMLVDYGVNLESRRGIEQAAASRESSKEKKEDKSGDDWLKDLNPDQKRMLGELLKEFIS